MTKEEMKHGLEIGRVLIQEEWSSKAEIEAVDELIAEGVAVATEWLYSDGYQCEYRKVRGKGK